MTAGAIVIIATHVCLLAAALVCCRCRLLMWVMPCQMKQLWMVVLLALLWTSLQMGS